jgi:hypothetical protein
MEQQIKNAKHTFNWWLWTYAVGFLGPINWDTSTILLDIIRDGTRSLMHGVTHLDITGIIWTRTPTPLRSRNSSGWVIKRSCQRLGHNLLCFDLVGHISLINSLIFHQIVGNRDTNLIVNPTFEIACSCKMS